MAIPASAIPAGNSYSIHIAEAGSAEPASIAQSTARQKASPPESNILSVTAAVTSALLKPHGVDVRQHLTGDDAAAQRQRDFLTQAGATTRAFSPAPAPDVPGEGFWKTTLAVVYASGSQDFWWPVRAEKKVEWDCLRVALQDRSQSPADLPADKIRSVDLWIVSIPSHDASGEVKQWIAQGAGAVAVIGPNGIAWASRSVSFGNAQGSAEFDLARNTPPGETLQGTLDAFRLGCFAGGVVAGLIEELLGENLFDKSIVRVERDELEARPLHIARAANFGGAAARASYEETPVRLLHKPGDLTGRVRAIVRAEHPEGKPWGSKGR